MAIKPDYRIGRLSLLGLAGFIVGCFFLFYPDLLSPNTKGAIFHEVEYSPKQIVDKRLVFVIDSLKKVDSSKQVEKAMLTVRVKKLKDENPLKDTLTVRLAELDKKITIVLGDIKRLNEIRNSYDYTSVIDTASFKTLNDGLHIRFTPEDLKEWDSAYCEDEKNSFKDVGYALKDKQLSFSIEDSTRLEIRNASSDIGFITKYPNAGLWTLMMMVFCSFLFIATSTSFYLRDQIGDLFDSKEIDNPSIWHYVGIIAITIIGIFLMWFIGKISFNDDEVVRCIFFLRNITKSMFWVQIVGFIAGSCCLAGFIYAAGMLVYFVRKAKELQVSYNKKNAELNSTKKEKDKDEADIVKLDKDIKTKETELNVIVENLKSDKERFDKLSDYFQTYFTLSAVILSLLVLCTGFLHGTINDLDFVKMIRSDWGYSPARTDFIYLYGGFYTVILLLVYIPTKMRFSEISFPNFAGSDVGSTANTSGDKKWFGFFKNPFGKLSDLLVATSPLLASLVQSLFEMLFD